MNVRRVGEDELGTVQELWRAFESGQAVPLYAELDVEEELAEVAEIVRTETALIAEDDEGTPIGLVLAKRRGKRLARITDLYVAPEARRRGIASELVREAVAVLAAAGAEHVDLEVLASNATARAVYARWGFRETMLTLVAPVGDLRARLEEAAAVGASFGAVHIQSDDVPAVERAVRQFVPRLPGGSRGSIVSQPRNGWIAVYDDVCDRDPQQLRRLARELSDRMGAVSLALGVERGAVVRFVLHEYGRIVDEYLSVQEYYGPLPPGDVIALQANPRVVARLTGADPAAVRAAAVHAVSPADLPPPEETLAALAAAMSIDGADHGWADAPELPGAIRVERE